MKLRRTILSRCRLVATVAGIGLAAGVACGAQIRFSKPAVPLVAPPQEGEQVPTARDKRPDFGASPMEQTVVSQPAIIYVPSRERENDEDAGRHPWLRDPKKFPDATGRADARSLFAPNRAAAGSQGSSNAPVWKRTDTSPALSPITDFHWDPRNNDRNDRSNSFSGSRFSSSEKKDSRSLDPFNRDNSDGQSGEYGSSFLSDMFAPRPKEKLTEGQLERRADFDRMLNPNGNGNTMTRAGGSLEPVTGLDPLKPAAPVTIPSMAPPKLDSRPLDMIGGFNQQQARLRGPVMDDPTRKYNPAPSTPAVAGAVDPRFQIPLRQQPTVREIPSRKF